jgi:hypothetical protein
VLDLHRQLEAVQNKRELPVPSECGVRMSWCAWEDDEGEHDASTRLGAWPRCLLIVEDTDSTYTNDVFKSSDRRYRGCRTSLSYWHIETPNPNVEPCS